MDVAIVAPCPVPYVIGGAENLWRGLHAYLNDRTEHQAEVFKLPAHEHEFFDLVDSYRRFSELDLTGFDVVVSGKYPAWMTHHPRHVLYLLHPLRGLYDTFHYFGLPERLDAPPASVADLLAFMDAHEQRRDALPELFERIAALQRAAPSLAPELFAFPGTLIRLVVQWLDRVAFAGVSRFGAISATVRDRPGYHPPGSDVFVAYPPTPMRPVADPPMPRRGGYLFTASRLDAPKRIDLLVEAMAHVRSDARLRIAGAGPEEARLRKLAAGNPRVELCGRVSDEQLAQLYAGARAIAFVAYDEDFGLVTHEAMLSAKPVITCRDSGGPTELVADGVNGVVCDPDPTAIAAAIDRLWETRGLTRRMGRAGRERGREITWDRVVDALLAA